MLAFGTRLTIFHNSKSLFQWLLLERAPNFSLAQGPKKGKSGPDSVGSKAMKMLIRYHGCIYLPYLYRVSHKNDTVTLSHNFRINDQNPKFDVRILHNVLNLDHMTLHPRFKFWIWIVFESYGSKLWCRSLWDGIPYMSISDQWL